jgi:membrane protease YdiL (CAAX protease family)
MIFLDRDKRLRNGWWILAFFLPLGGMLIAMSALLQTDGKIPVEQQLMMVLVLTCVLQLARRRPLTEIFGAPDAGSLKGFLLGGVAGTLLMALPAALLAAGGWVRFELAATGASALWPGLILLLPAAVLEELVFRGFVFRCLQAGLGLVPALAITSAFFLLTHLGNPGMVGLTKILAALNIFIASILFGLALVRSGGLAMPIGLHLAANFTQSSVFGFGVSGNVLPGMLVPQFGSAPVWLTGGQFGLEASMPCLLAVIALTVIMYRYRSVDAPS